MLQPCFVEGTRASLGKLSRVLKNKCELHLHSFKCPVSKFVSNSKVNFVVHTCVKVDQSAHAGIIGIPAC